MKQIPRNNTTELVINLQDVLTPASCCNIMEELVKYIAYNKELIPYPFDRLKLYIDKQMEYVKMAENGTNLKLSNRTHILLTEKYSKKMTEAYNYLTKTFEYFEDEITNSKTDNVREILIILGNSLLCPQDTFRIQIPPLDYIHTQAHHSMIKNRQSMFRSIIESDSFLKFISNNNSASNLFVMLKTRGKCSRGAIPRHNYEIPARCRNASISFQRSKTSSMCPCFSVYRDECEETRMEIRNNDKCQEAKWYQVKDCLRCFTDVKINGMSITDIWLNPKNALLLK